MAKKKKKKAHYNDFSFVETMKRAELLRNTLFVVVVVFVVTFLFAVNYDHNKIANLSPQRVSIMELPLGYLALALVTVALYLSTLRYYSEKKIIKKN